MICALLQPWRRRRAAAADARHPPVSVIVPTSALGTVRASVERAQTIASLLELDYSPLERLVCFDSADPGEALARQLQDRHPVDVVRVLFARQACGPNRKIAAMAAAADQAAHEILLFCDDDVAVSPDHLERLLEQLNGGGVGLVSTAAIGVRPKNFWGHVELAFMNGQFARLHLAGDFLGWSGALGKTIMIRKADLQRAGGLRAASADCCEDAALTRNIKTAGFRVALSPIPVQQPVLDQRPGEVWRRHVRWLGCRRKYLTVIFAGEVLFSAPVAIAAGGIATAATPRGAAVGIGVSIALWCGADLAFARLARWPVSWMSPFAWAVREVMFLPMWMHALSIRTVIWHGRRVPLSAA